jgi:hypothetical protein
MFEYMDKEIVVAFILLLLASLLFTFSARKTLENKKRLIITSLLPILFMIVINFISSGASSNINAVKNGVSLKCWDADKEYRVSLKDDWEIDKNYFVKESLMIRADKCEGM